MFTNTVGMGEGDCSGSCGAYAHAAMTIRPLQPKDFDEWRRMRCALWPTFTPEQIDAEAREHAASGSIHGAPTVVFVADRGDGRLGGFVDASLRPMADGCRTSPVGYLEGWYVDEDARRQGVGGALVRAAEEWARARGCTEMASDCLGWNHVSFTAHQHLGYATAEREITFHKAIDGADPSSPHGFDWVALSPHDLCAAAAVRFVSDGVAGGIAVFLGTTRAENSASGQPLVALDYESYPEMAIAQMRDLARRARERWPIARLALLHRTGRVPVGDPSVIIAVASPHRAEAFDACEWLIDTLKVEVAVWKKEVWADGSGTWVNPAPQAERIEDGG
jgi:molybdopterin synthase catalytic subunit/predicted N-acetyltransferase YhbS